MLRLLMSLPPLCCASDFVYAFFHACKRSPAPDECISQPPISHLPKVGRTRCSDDCQRNRYSPIEPKPRRSHAVRVRVCQVEELSAEQSLPVLSFDHAAQKSQMEHILP